MVQDDRFFDEIEGMPVSSRQSYYDREVRRIASYAYNHSKAMRSIFDAACIKPGDIRSVKDLEKVPVTPKGEIRRLQKEYQPFGGLLACPVGKLARIFVSPGPIYDVEGRNRSVAEAKAFYAMGFRPGDVVINAFSYHFVRAGWSMDEGLEKLGCVIIPAGVGNTELQVQVMHDLKVKGFAGTPSFLMALIQKAESMGYDFRKDFELRLAYLGAERLTPSSRRVFEEDYGISTGDSYGTAELGQLAYSCSQRAGLHVPEEVFVEIVDPATGEQMPRGELGEVVATSFDRTFPVLRVGTGDLSFFDDEPCRCGRTSNRLVKIAGRVTDSVKVRGIFVHPKEVEGLVDSMTQVSNFHMIVSRPSYRDELTVKLELSCDINEQKNVCETLQNRFQDICRIKIDTIEIVPSGTLARDNKRLTDTRNWD
ncbi:MAG: AMP-binding protein [Dehalococcoidia bacterium]|nr:AMP-binding protein [Dehalococcoidia bacterium]MDZ4246022.1 AMP-binding protein [Dehalococcoidia bacterium]